MNPPPKLRGRAPGSPHLPLAVMSLPSKWLSSSPAPGGGRFGLVGLRERAAGLNGQLDIRSAPGQGVEISLTVPLAGE